MKKILALVFALIVATVAFGVTASAVEVTKPEIPTVTMPEVPAKDGYTVTWDTTIEKATGNATVNAVYTKNAVSDNPQTGDNSNLWLWWILLIVSAASITVLCIEQKKRRATK